MLFNLDEQTSLKTLLGKDVYNSLSKITSLDDIAIVQEHLDL